MAGIEVVLTELGIPLVRLSGPLAARNGAELADQVMALIHHATEDPSEFPHPLSQLAPCVRAPETWTGTLPVGD